MNPDALALLLTSDESLAERFTRPENAGWPMLSAWGELKPNKPLILGFVIVFAALGGAGESVPLAPAVRRHRLFWTTPLLSLGESVLLMTVIVLQ